MKCISDKKQIVIGSLDFCIKLH